MQQENRSYESLKKRLKKQRFTHNLAGKYYGSLYQKLTIPTIVITGLVSMVSGSSGGSNEIQRENQKLENCAGILKKYVDCLQLHNYNDIQPECVEIKKMMETMECNK